MLAVSRRKGVQSEHTEGQRFLQPQHCTRNPAGYDAVQFRHGLSVLPLATCSPIGRVN